jgi:hypothetical protein
MQELELRITRGRLYAALIAYAVLALVAAATLDGPLRLVTWIFLGGLAVKSWLAYVRERRR